MDYKGLVCSYPFFLVKLSFIFLTLFVLLSPALLCFRYV